MLADVGWEHPDPEAVPTGLCRPSEVVLDLLDVPQRGAFIKEDGEVVIDAVGKHVGRIAS